MAKKDPEVYPNPGEEKRQLQQRADEFLDKEQKRDEVLKTAENAEERESADKADASGAAAADEPAPLKEARKGAEPSETKAQAESAQAPQKPAKPRQVTPLTMFLLIVLMFVVGLYLGNSLNGNDVADKTDAKKDPVTQEVKKDLSLHNVVKKDEVYGVSLEVDQVKRRVDGLYVTFKVTNNGQKQVYFMANTMKLVGDDGKVYLPELGQGEIPSSFTGGGVSVGTTEEATLVFLVPGDVQPASFILENVTNLKNGSWAFQIDLDGQDAKVESEPAE